MQHRLLAPVFLVLAAAPLIEPIPLFSAGCPAGSCTLVPSCNDTGLPVPETLWGTLRPLDTEALPPARNTAWWSHLPPHPPLFLDVAPLDEMVVVAVGTGAQIWKYDAANDFSRLSHTAFDAASGLFGTHRLPPEVPHPFSGVATLPSLDLVALGSSVGGGVVVLDAQAPGAPLPLAQLYGVDVHGLAFVPHPSAPFLLAGASGFGLPSGGALLRLALPSESGAEPCLATMASPGCGFAPSLVAGSEGVSSVAVDGEFVVGSGPSLGLRGWRVDAAGELERGLELDLSTTGTVVDVALWRHGGRLVLASLALRPTGEVLELRDVTCLAHGGCAGTPPLLGATAVPNARNLSFSRHGGRPHLAVSSAAHCQGGLQNEWIFDVSSPSTPHDLTPPAGIHQGIPTGYWGWYEAPNPTGTHRVASMAGVWSNGGYVRAAKSLLDLHLPVEEPRADFDLDSLEIYAGQLVTVTSTSAGAPVDLEWDLGDDGSVDATGPEASFVLPQAGLVPLRLTASTGGSTTSQLRTIEVLAICPAIAGVASPSSVGICSTVELDARGRTGQEPSTLSWEIEHPTLGVLATATDIDPLAWTAGAELAGVTPQVTVHATVTSAACGPATTSRSLGLTTPAAPAPPATIHTNLVGPGRVRFFASGAAGLEWSWDFDEDHDATTREWTAWTSVPSSRTIVHQYLSPNPGATEAPREVRVRLRTCLAAAVESSPRQLWIESVDPVSILQFRIGCPDPICFAAAGLPVPIEVETSGDIHSYHFDWLGDQTDVEIRVEPPSEHIYCWDMPVLVRPYLTIQGWGTSAQGWSQNEVLIEPGPGCSPLPPALFVDGFEAGDFDSWH